MRIVGTSDHSEIELYPVKAYRRGLILDAMLSTATPQMKRGVTRGTHAYFNHLDAERQVHTAHSLNVA